MKRAIAAVASLAAVVFACSAGPSAQGPEEEEVASSRQALAYCNGVTCAQGEGCCNGYCTPIAGRCGTTCNVCSDNQVCSSGHCCAVGRWWCGSTGACVANACDCPPDLDAWLAAHPNVAAAMKWQYRNTTANAYEPAPSDQLAYPQWSAAMKQYLEASYHARYTALCKGTPFTETLRDPPPNVDETAVDPMERPYTSIPAADAQLLYLSTVAHALAVEIGHFVPWSVTSYDAASLAILFDSGAMMSREVFSASYAIGGWFSAYVASHRDANRGLTVPPPPYKAYRLMRGQGPGATVNLVGATRFETIVNLTLWARTRLVHYYAPVPDHHQDYVDTWGYNGLAPVTRVINGTTSVSPYLPPGESATEHWTAGCGGTGGFFRDVLRTVNIPVVLPRVCTHYQIHFPTEGVYLDHGDAPYSGYEAATFPVSLLFIPESTYTSWYGTNRLNEDQFEAKTSVHCNNVARRELEIFTLYGIPY
ncbi:MAG: hypothetical protein JNL38_31395 [Myxococcales bacterium]|nr:hypothetical protein [Myxococcales bacterium]